MKAVICDECQTSYHLYCLASTVSPDAVAAKCLVCKGNVPLAVGDGTNAANGNSGNGGRSGGEKRKRAAVVVSESESD